MKSSYLILALLIAAPTTNVFAKTKNILDKLKPTTELKKTKNIILTKSEETFNVNGNFNISKKLPKIGEIQTIETTQNSVTGYLDKPINRKELLLAKKKPDQDHLQYAKMFVKKVTHRTNK